MTGARLFQSGICALIVLLVMLPHKLCVRRGTKQFRPLAIFPLDDLLLREPINPTHITMLNKKGGRPVSETRSNREMRCRTIQVLQHTMSLDVLYKCITFSASRHRSFLPWSSERQLTTLNRDQICRPCSFVAIYHILHQSYED